MSLDVSQIRQLASSIDNDGRRVGARAAAGLRVSARAVEQSQRQTVAVDTGETQRSIGTDFYGSGRSGKMTAVVGPTTPQALPLEYGNARVAPQPFVGPALDRHTEGFYAAMDRAATPDIA